MPRGLQRQHCGLLACIRKRVTSPHSVRQHCCAVARRPWRCHTGLGPETVDFSAGTLQKGVGYNILRPEAVEAICMLYRITNDTIYRDWGWQIFEAFDKYSKVGSTTRLSAKLQALKHDLPTSVRRQPTRTIS